MSFCGRSFSNLYDLVVCMTRAIDLISPEVSNHHLRVASLAYAISEKLGLSLEQKQTLVLATLLHDTGALSSNERLALIEEESAGVENHAFIGATLLEDFPPLRKAAEIVRFHHLPWNGGKGRSYHGEEVPILSHILHLSDRIVVQVNDQENVISQISRIRASISSRRNTLFMPELVDAFLEISVQEALWLDLVFSPTVSKIPDDLAFDALRLTLDEVVDLTKVFSRIIDFRSPFTARHSAAVAATAEKLAELASFSEDECKMMKIAGNLHDIGKLAIPREIIEKQDKLDPAEFDMIRSHAYYTYQLLRPISGFETITQWASYHHEKMNGNGYPFHLKAGSLPLGSRIMAVADIFTAITEDRPYRKGMTDAQTREVLGKLAENGSISPRVLSLLMEHYEMIADIRREAAEGAASYYQRIVCRKP
jgi:HD-GYP domain-containing protein (c-di-GMP phosphodiesterase class II)